VPTQLLPSARRCEIKDAKNSSEGSQTRKKYWHERGSAATTFFWTRTRLYEFVQVEKSES